MTQSARVVGEAGGAGTVDPPAPSALLGDGLGQRARKRAWIIYLELGILAAVSYLLIDPFRGSRPVYHLVGVSSATAILLAVHVHRPQRPLAWQLFGLAVVMFVVGDLVAINYSALFGAELPFPSLADVPTLAVRGLLIAGLAVLVRRRNPGGDVTSLIDSLMIATGGAMVAWVILVAPYVSSSLSLSSELTAVAYPMLDVVLLAVTARLAVGGGHRTPSFYLLVAGTLTLLATDGFYGWTQLGHSSFGTLLDLGWLSFYLLWACAALHPSMRTLDDPASEREPQGYAYRLVLLGAAAFTGPVLQIIQSVRRAPVGAGLFGAGSVIMVALVLLRLKGLMVDIAERKSSELALRKSLEREKELVEKLKELDRMKSDFVSSVSHELRTPLTSIMGYMELMEGEEGEPLGDMQRGYLQVVERNAQRLLNLIEDLLTLSRIESGAFKLEITAVDVRTIILSVHEAVAPALGARSLSLELDLPEQPHRVMGDADQLERALLNLISNAIKFSPENGAITVSAHAKDGLMSFAVADKGMGIPMEEQAGLFSRFFRSSLSQQKAVQGTGLGLTIVKTIVEQHAGTIALQSAPGEGTTVTFTVPLAEPAENGEVAPPLPATSSKGD